MSHANKKVKWCVAKAQKELAEGNKHRGLIEIKPDLDEAKKHILKAEHNFKAVINFEKSGFSDWSVSAVFYTIYHCLLAISLKHGFESRNQECTIALIEQLNSEGKIKFDSDIINELKNVNIEDKHVDNTISLRENFQYGTATSIEDHKLSELKELCRTAIEQTKEIIYS